MRKIGEHFKQHAYIWSLGMAMGILLVYSVYYFSNDVHDLLHEYSKIMDYLAHVSMLLFTAGIFTVTLKYFQFQNLFQEEFNKAISSDEFDKKLSRQLKQITFSRKFLLDQSNLNSIWEKVTLCMYEREFPEIYEKVKKKIKNRYFEKQSIAYYYKNMQLHYSVDLVDGKYIKMEQNIAYTIIRPSTDKFTWDFGYMYKESDDTQIGVSFEGAIITCNKTLSSENAETIAENGHILKKVSLELEGHKEYHIEYSCTSVENLFEDRIHSFSSDRIIDDFTISIENSDKIEVVFAPVNKQHFYRNNVYPTAEHAYINRDIFLPGEKFKLFFIKK